MVNKRATLRLELVEPKEMIEIHGRILRFEAVEGRSDIAAFAMKFDEEGVPMEYKLRLSNYLRGLARGGYGKGRPQSQAAQQDQKSGDGADPEG